MWLCCMESQDELYIERILLDQRFTEEKLKEVERLFWLAIIPELERKWFTRGDTHGWLTGMSSVTDDLNEDADKINIKMMMIMMMVDHGVIVSNQESQVLWLGVKIPSAKSDGFT